MKTEEFKRVYNETRNGANTFYRHSLVRNVAYSDGVRDLAETGCWWLIDKIATEVPSVIVAHNMKKSKGDVCSSQCAVTAKVSRAKVDLTGEIEDGVVAWSRKNIWTDLPDGEWKFLVGESFGEAAFLLILISEY